MKPSRLMIMVACFSLTCALFNGVCFALEQDDARVSLNWSSEALYSGSNTTVNIFFISDYSEELTIYSVGLHFDWMESETFLGYNLINNPVTVPSNGSHNFYPINVLVPENVTVGAHSYYVGIDGLEGGSTDFTWDSRPQTVMIQNSAQEVYNNLKTEVADDIADALDADYRSSAAQSFLEQAEDAYDQALSLASDENWDAAILALQSASGYVEQADLNEQSYVEPETLDDSLLLIVGVAAVAVVAVLVVALIVRRKGKQAAAPVEQTNET